VAGYLLWLDLLCGWIYFMVGYILWLDIFYGWIYFVIAYILPSMFNWIYLVTKHFILKIIDDLTLSLIRFKVGCILWSNSFCVKTLCRYIFCVNTFFVNILWGYFLCGHFVWKLFVDTFESTLFLFSFPCSSIIYNPFY